MKAHRSDTAIKPEGSFQCNCHGATLLLFTFLVLAIPASLFAGATLLKSENGGALVELGFDAGDYTLSEVAVNGEPCVAVKLNGATYTPYTQTKGYPALPYMTASIAIPGTAAMGLEIVSQDVRELRVKKIVPSRGAVKRTIDPAAVPYTFGGVYDKNEWYPARTVTIGEPYLLNAVRGMAVTFHPFRYNAKSGVLEVTTSIVVRVKRTGTSAVNALSARDRIITPAFEGLYARRFINFDAMRPLYTYVPDGDKMIVITPPSLREAVRPLVDWKNQKGIAATVFEYPSQTGGSGHAALADFLKGKYASEKTAYIILVGDASDIPAPTAFEALSDPSYTKLNGADDYPDAFLGRLCSSKPGDIAALVKKTIDYEKFPHPEVGWYQKAVGIGSQFKFTSTQMDQEWIKQYRAKMLPYGYTTVDELYDDPGASKTTLIAALNQGRSWVNYMGEGNTEHINTTGFAIPDISSLTNAGMPVIWIGIACYNGEYAKTCLAEAMTCAADKGALVQCGSYTAQDWTAPQAGMTEMIEQLLVKDKCLSVGAIFYNGDCKIVEVGEEASVETFLTWIFFGDPSVMHFTKTPKVLTVTAPEAVGKGNQQVSVTFGDSITGRVALYDSVNKRLLGSTILAAKAASAAVTATIPDNITSVTLTVTAFNRVTVIRTLKVGNVATSPDQVRESPVSLTLRQGKSAVYFTTTGPSTMRTELRVFDLLGHLVCRQAGERIAPWRYDNGRGARIARGMYFAVIKLFDRDRVVQSRTFVLGVE